MQEGKKEDLFKTQISKLNQNNKILLGLMMSALYYSQTLNSQDIANYEEIILKDTKKITEKPSTFKVFLHKNKNRNLGKKQPLYTGWLNCDNCRFQIGGWEYLEDYEFFLNLRFVKKISKGEEIEKGEENKNSLVAKLYRNKYARDDNKQPVFKGCLYFSEYHFQIASWENLEERKDTITLYFTKLNNNLKKEALK